MTDISSYIDQHLDESLDELRRYVALPSVAAQKQSIPETAAFVKEMLESVGASAEILEKEAPGHPVVVGELPGASSKTLLLYNHYDVQPPEPFELWTGEPFVMRRDGDKLFARGISDNKGHLISRLLAIRALQAANGGNVAGHDQVPRRGRRGDRQREADGVRREAPRAARRGRVFARGRRRRRGRAAARIARREGHRERGPARADGRARSPLVAGRDGAERGVAADVGARLAEGAGRPRAHRGLLRRRARADRAGGRVPARDPAGGGEDEGAAGAARLHRRRARATTTSDACCTSRC